MEQKQTKFDQCPLISKMARHLGKPISILDTETTGLGKPEEVGIVDFAVITFLPEENNRSIHFQTLLQTEIPLSEGASKVHGIYPEDLVGAPFFDSIAKPVMDIFKDRIVCGFNSVSYDAPILRARINDCIHEECPEGTHLDVRMIYTKGNQYGKGKLVDVAQKYGVPVINAHRAMGDVKMTAGVLETMLNTMGQYEVLQYIQVKTVDNEDNAKPSALLMQ